MPLSADVLELMRIRAAAHIHSDWSYDGQWPLHRLAEAFSRRNYDLLLMTEHQHGFSEARRLEYWEACRKASSPEILLLPGIEYNDGENTVHILVWGPVPFLDEGFTIEQLLAHVVRNGGVAVLAHPSRRDAWKLFVDSWKPLLVGIELWNRKTDGWSPSSPAAELLKRSGLPALVGLDFHDRRQFFPISLALELSGTPTEASVTSALQAGSLKCQFMGMPFDASVGSRRIKVLRFLEKCRRFIAPWVRDYLYREGMGVPSR